jgi:hypothetical protein
MSPQAPLYVPGWLRQQREAQSAKSALQSAKSLLLQTPADRSYRFQVAPPQHGACPLPWLRYQTSASHSAGF